MAVWRWKARSTTPGDWRWTEASLYALFDQGAATAADVRDGTPRFTGGPDGSLIVGAGYDEGYAAGVAAQLTADRVSVLAVAGSISTAVQDLLGTVDGTLDMGLYVLKTSVVDASWVVTGHDNYTGGSAGSYPTTATTQAAQHATDTAFLGAHDNEIIPDDPYILAEFGVTGTAPTGGGGDSTYSEPDRIDVIGWADESQDVPGLEATIPTSRCHWRPTTGSATAKQIPLVVFGETNLGFVTLEDLLDLNELIVSVNVTEIETSDLVIDSEEVLTAEHRILSSLTDPGRGVRFRFTFADGVIEPADGVIYTLAVDYTTTGDSQQKRRWIRFRIASEIGVLCPDVIAVGESNAVGIAFAGAIELGESLVAIVVEEVVTSDLTLSESGINAAEFLINERTAKIAGAVQVHMEGQQVVHSPYRLRITAITNSDPPQTKIRSVQFTVVEV